jgi:peptidoglycan/LPS O-acetylase OafA/YrhL
VSFAYLAVVTALYHNQFSWRDITLAWTFQASIGLAFSDNFPWSLSHLWSLSVEEWYYAVWPLLLATSLYSARYAAWAAVIIAPFFRFVMNKQGLDSAALFAPPSVMDSIATGCLLALYYRPLTYWVTRHRRWLWVVWPMAFLTPVLIVIGDNTHIFWPIPQALGHTSWTLFNVCTAVGIIWAIVAKPRILNHPVAVWVGVLSFGLYLWHMPIMAPELSIKFPFNLLFAFAIATISYHLIEQPLLELRTSLRSLPSFALANS